MTPLRCDLHRQSSGDEGTIGNFFCPEIGFSSFTLEQPYRDNLPMLSCVLPGVYRAEWVESVRHKKYTYRLEDKNKRVGILIESFSYCGDVNKGFKSDSHGCIALGFSLSRVDLNGSKNQLSIYDSRAAVMKFERLAEERPLIIEIHPHSVYFP